MPTCYLPDSSAGAFDGPSLRAASSEKIACIDERIEQVTEPAPPFLTSSEKIALEPASDEFRTEHNSLDADTWVEETEASETISRAQSSGLSEAECTQMEDVADQSPLKLQSHLLSTQSIQFEDSTKGIPLEDFADQSPLNVQANCLSTAGIPLEDLAELRTSHANQIAEIAESHKRFRALLRELELEHEMLRSLTLSTDCPLLVASASHHPHSRKGSRRSSYRKSDASSRASEVHHAHASPLMAYRNGSAIDLSPSKAHKKTIHMGNGSGTESALGFLPQAKTSSMLNLTMTDRTSGDDSSVSDAESEVCQRWSRVIQSLLKGIDNCVVREGWTSTTEYQRMDTRRKDSELERFRLMELKAMKPQRPGWYLRGKSSNATYMWGSMSWRRKCVTHPAAPSRRLWMFLAFLMIVYEFFSITMAPFEILETGLINNMEKISAAFWLFDIYINFTNGIYVKGRVETTFSVVARHYIRTWFLFDLTLVVMQFVALWNQDKQLGAAGAMKLVRVTRSLRLSRQLMRLKEQLGLSSIGNTLLFSKIGACNMGLYLFVHCNACLFYEIGQGSSDGWVKQNQGELSSSGLHNYLVSLHWSLSQLQGSIDIFPGRRSTSDRLFCVVSSCASIVVLALVVSMMTDTLVNVRQQRKRRADENRCVRIFFSKHDIRPEIRARADHHLMLRERQQEALNDTELNQLVLQMFPLQFQTLLMAEIQGYQLTWHPIFAYLDKYHRPVFIKACSSIISIHSFEPNDDAFTAGSVSDHAFIILKGEFVLNVSVDISVALSPWLTKFQATRGSRQVGIMGRAYSSNFADLASEKEKEKELKSRVKPFRRLEHGQLVGEAALWMSWTHVGSLCSVDHGQCNSISATDLIDIVKHHPVAHAVVSFYARRFAATAAALCEIDKADAKIELMTFHTVIELETQLMDDGLGPTSSCHLTDDLDN